MFTLIILFNAGSKSASKCWTNNLIEEKIMLKNKLKIIFCVILKTKRYWNITNAFAVSIHIIN